MFFITEKTKEKKKFFTRNCESIFDLFYFKMTQCKTLNVKLSSSQIDKLRSERKTGTKVTLKISSNVGDSNNKNTFTHKISLTNTEV